MQDCIAVLPVVRGFRCAPLRGSSGTIAPHTGQGKWAKEFWITETRAPPLGRNRTPMITVPPWSCTNTRNGIITKNQHTAPGNVLVFVLDQ